MYVCAQLCACARAFMLECAHACASVLRCAVLRSSDAFAVFAANLRRYGISVDELSAALTSDPRVHAFSIFIASLFDEAERLASALPFGRSKVRHRCCAHLVLMQMWLALALSSLYKCGSSEISSSADLGAASRVLVQMWAG